ncbi:MAG: hypothetical protein AAFQ42_03725 [Pseudomonadota bacterium]
MRLSVFNKPAILAVAGLVGVLGLATVHGGVSQAVAQQDQNAGRFQMERTDDGLIRLDTVTGALSLCRSEDGALTCAPVSGGAAAAAPSADLAALQSENRRLKKRIDQLEADLDAKPRAVPAPSGYPSEADVDRAFSFVEGLIRRFKSLADDLREDQPQGTPL